MACRVARWSALARLRCRIAEADSSAPSRLRTSASTAIGSRWSGPAWLGAGWRWCRVSGAFAAGAVVAAEFGGGPGAGLWVGGPGRGGEHEGEVGVGAAGHGGVQPLPVFGAGDQRDAGVHGGALGGVPGDRVGEVGGLVAVIAEGPGGEPALPGRWVGVEQAADHDAAAGDGLDPQDVAVGQGPARLARLEVVVVGPADDQVPGGGFGAVGDPDGPASVDEAEVDQVVADPGGQFPAAGPVRGHQQDVASGSGRLAT